MFCFIKLFSRKDIFLQDNLKFVAEWNEVEFLNSKASLQNMILKSGRNVNFLLFSRFVFSVGNTTSPEQRHSHDFLKHFTFPVLTFTLFSKGIKFTMASQHFNTCLCTFINLLKRKIHYLKMTTLDC